MKTLKRMRKIEELAIEVGDRCNFKCDHCGVGEFKNLTLSSGEIGLLTHSIEQYKFKEILFIGGETTLYIREINNILKEISRTTAPNVAITTNGYFAKNKSAAKKTLSSILRLSALQLSYDKYHCKFLPFEYVESLRAACSELGVHFSVLTTIQDPMDLVVLKKLWKLGDIPVGISKVLPIGNARENSLGMRYPSFNRKILSELCPGRNKLVYLCGRGFSSCCSLLAKRKGFDAIVGETVAEYLKSPFYSLVSKNSFLDLARKFRVSIKNMPSECSSPCVLCDRIFPLSSKT